MADTGQLFVTLKVEWKEHAIDQVTVFTLINT